ncbi:hypothetical protein ASD54_21670 [Rhizobium sp. Root149]|nr:hypothetical protein ASD54_21670 [Rhizobium sp. Root149]
MTLIRIHFIWKNKSDFAVVPINLVGDSGSKANGVGRDLFVCQHPRILQLLAQFRAHIKIVS